MFVILLSRNNPRPSTHLGKPNESIINGPNRLLNRFFESPSNSHNLADALHAAAERFANPRELLQIPTRNFYDAVVQTRFETCCRDLCNRVLDFVKWDPKTEFRGDERERIAGCL